MTDMAELNTGSEYNNTLEALRKCGSVERWVALDKPEHSPHTRELLVKLVDRIPRLSNGDRENDVEQQLLAGEHSHELSSGATPRS